MGANEAISTKSALSRICGLTEYAIDALARDGVIPAPQVKGQYDVPACLTAYIAHLRATRVPKLCSAEELAQEFGVAKITVLKATQESGMPQHSRGLWDRVACWRHRVERAGSRTSAEATELQEERRKLLVEQRRRARVEADAAERIYVRRDEVEDGWKLLVGIFRAELLALPGRLAAEVSNVTTPAQVRQIIDVEARRVLDRLSSNLGALAGRLRGDGGK
jgi:hypothetical protein